MGRPVLRLGIDRSIRDIPGWNEAYPKLVSEVVNYTGYKKANRPLTDARGLWRRITKLMNWARGGKPHDPRVARNESSILPHDCIGDVGVNLRIGWVRSSDATGSMVWPKKVSLSRRVLHDFFFPRTEGWMEFGRSYRHTHHHLNPIFIDLNSVPHRTNCCLLL
jgi:hypothetical protein